MPPLRKLSALEANKYSRLEGAPQLTWYKAGGRGELMLLGDTHPENDDEIIYDWPWRRVLPRGIK